MDQQKFEVSGAAGRDCPVCARVGSLIGARDGDAPILTCNGCANVFRLVWAPNDAARDTLVRLTAPAAAAPYKPPRSAA